MGHSAEGVQSTNLASPDRFCECDLRCRTRPANTVSEKPSLLFCCGKIDTNKIVLVLVFVWSLYLLAHRSDAEERAHKMIHVVLIARRALGTEQQFQESVDLGAPLGLLKLLESARGHVKCVFHAASKMASEN
jgi:hypothetical protein